MNWAIYLIKVTQYLTQIFFPDWFGPTFFQTIALCSNEKALWGKLNKRILKEAHCDLLEDDKQRVLGTFLTKVNFLSREKPKSRFTSPILSCTNCSIKWDTSGGMSWACEDYYIKLLYSFNNLIHDACSFHRLCSMISCFNAINHE